MPRAALAAPTPGLAVSSPGATAMVWSAVGHPLAAVAVPGVQLASGDALVAVELATLDGADRRVLSGADSVASPLVLGHAQVGTIVDAGRTARDVSGHRLEIGDRVVWSPFIPCGTCARCRHGERRACTAPTLYGRERMRRGWELTGSLATHVHILAGTPIARVPHDIAAPSLTTAATVADAIAALEASERIVPLSGELVMVSGAGTLGLALIALGKDAGAIVLVSEPNAERGRLAERFGADLVVRPVVVPDEPPRTGRPRIADRQTTAIDSELAAAVRRLGRRTGGCRVVIETSGSAAGLVNAVGLAAVGGVVVLAGGSERTADAGITPHVVTDHLLTVRGSRRHAGTHLRRAVDYLATAGREHPFADLVTEVFALADGDAAVAAALVGPAGRVGVTPYA